MAGFSQRTDLMPLKEARARLFDEEERLDSRHLCRPLRAFIFAARRLVATNEPSKLQGQGVA